MNGVRKGFRTPKKTGKNTVSLESLEMAYFVRRNNILILYSNKNSSEDDRLDAIASFILMTNEMLDSMRYLSGKSCRKLFSHLIEWSKKFYEKKLPVYEGVWGLTEKWYIEALMQISKDIPKELLDSLCKSYGYGGIDNHVSPTSDYRTTTYTVVFKSKKIVDGVETIVDAPVKFTLESVTKHNVGSWKVDRFGNISQVVSISSDKVYSLEHINPEKSAVGVYDFPELYVNRNMVDLVGTKWKSSHGNVWIIDSIDENTGGDCKVTISFKHPNRHYRFERYASALFNKFDFVS